MCPNCKVELKTKRYKGVRVDECENCRGIFFDKGELEKVKNTTDPDTRWIDPVFFAVTTPSALNKQQKDCPKCSVSMEPLQYASSKVTLNRCPNCQGVWLDHGEFSKIINYLTSLIASETSSELADEVKRQLAQVFSPHKKESDELKDLMAVARLLEERWSAEHPRLIKILETYYELTPFK